MFAGNVCIVITDDTDILIFSVRYFQAYMEDIFLFSTKRSKSVQKMKNVIDVTNPFIK